jgi:copper chaperone
MLEFQIDDMTCSHCEARILKALRSAGSPVSITVNLLKRRVCVTGLDARQAEAAITAAGYTPVAITST